MVSDSHQGMAGISAKELLDLEQWKKIQNLFAEIIGANLSLTDPSGTPVTAPSQVTASCFDFRLSKGAPRARLVGCITKAFQSWSQTEHIAFTCPHRLHFFSLPIHFGKELLGIITVGPVLVGKREDDRTYRLICEKEKIDFDHFLDRIRDMRIFSHNGIRVILDFLKELTQYFVRLASQRQELERLLPGFLVSKKGEEGVFSVTYSNLLANYLLEVASEVVKADSGSVLLVDKELGNFSFKSARGLKPEIIRKRRLPINAGVAGWVLSQGRPVLIRPESHSEVPKERLKRPQIKCSIVVPLEFQKKALGVFCLNAKSINRRFNQDNLVLLNQLGKLASVALARVSMN